MRFAKCTLYNYIIVIKKFSKHRVYRTVSVWPPKNERPLGITLRALKFYTNVGQVKRTPLRNNYVSHLQENTAIN